jgi:hypothetical protein
MLKKRRQAHKKIDHHGPVPYSISSQTPEPPHFSLPNTFKSRFSPLQMIKNIICYNMFLMFWKYAQMHQNPFFTTPEGKK